MPEELILLRRPMDDEEEGLSVAVGDAFQAQ